MSKVATTPEADVRIDRIRCARGSELGSDELARWRELQPSLEGWDSAFPTLEAARLVDGILPLEVALPERRGEPDGVFPSERWPSGLLLVRLLEATRRVSRWIAFR